MSEHTVAQGLAKIMVRLARQASLGQLASSAVATDNQTAWSDWDGVIILDACGCIVFCSAAAAELLGAKAAEVVGQQVTALIPELPFGRYTPEFNLAYVFFHGDDGVWSRRALKTRDGRRVPIDVSLGTSSEVGRRSIVLILKKADSAANDEEHAVDCLNELSNAAGA